MDSKKKFGLVMPKKSESLKVKAKSIFDDDSDEDAPTSKRPKIPQKKMDVKGKIESLEDPSIYEYDSIYDDMKAKQAESIAPKEKKNSRYIDTLLKAADKRKKEYERRVEKKIQVEREKEGDKYIDKETFVTSAYKKKMQEREEEEERERRETMLNDMMDVSKQNDLSGFYRHFLKQTVGEEKIPTFGEKRIKKEVVSDEEKEIKGVVSGEEKAIKEVVSGEDKEIKKEIISVEEKEKSDLCTDIVKSKDDDNQKLDDINIDRDSDGIEIDSDSDDSSGKKHSRNGSETSSSESHSDSEKQKRSNKPKKRISHVTSQNLSSEQTKTYRKSAPFSSESENEEGNSSQNGGKHTTSSKQQRNLSKGSVQQHRHDSTDDSEPDKTVNPDKHNNSERKKRNIYAKRTIGDVFADAQARYFQRMASRNGGIS